MHVAGIIKLVQILITRYYHYHQHINMKFTAAAALLFTVPSVSAFAPSTVAFRTSTQIYSTEAATEEKVGHDAKM